MKEAKEFLNDLLKENDTLVVATSGGPDSMFLLHILKSINKELKIICAHVNHGLRKESEKEKKFVKKYCQENNIIFEYMAIVKYEKNKFSESEARKIRYDYFGMLVKKYKAKYLMTAHHGDDLTETILMKIVRGSNLKGYIGIPKIIEKENYKLVRPLLNLDKESIINYLDKENIKYVIDKTNESELYTRNRYRKQLLPFLKKEDRLVHLKFLKFSEELEMYNNYINEIVKKKIERIYINNKININELLKEDEFIQKKIIEFIIEDIQKKEIFNINDKQLNNIINLLKEKNNKQINLADNFIARRSYNYLILEKNNNITDYKIELDSDEIIYNNYHFKVIKNSLEKSNYIIRLNTKELKLPLYFRNKLDGDKMKIKNLNGTKKLKDIFIDCKIDVLKRKEYPILVDSNDTVIWIPGIKKSIFDKEIDEKYDIMIMYVEGKNE